MYNFKPPLGAPYDHSVLLHNLKMHGHLDAQCKPSKHLGHCVMRSRC